MVCATPCARHHRLGGGGGLRVRAGQGWEGRCLLRALSFRRKPAASSELSLGLEARIPITPAPLELTSVKCLFLPRGTKGATSLWPRHNSRGQRGHCAQFSSSKPTILCVYHDWDSVRAFVFPVFSLQPREAQRRRPTNSCCRVQLFIETAIPLTFPGCSALRVCSSHYPI